MTTFETSQQSDLFPTELASMSSQAASPAKTSALQENKQVLRASAVDYGQSAPVLLGSFSPDTPSLKTSQTCLMENGELGLSEFSGTFPRSGMMRSGTVYQLPNLARTTTEIGSGLLPTLTAQTAGTNGKVKCKETGEWINGKPSLTTMASKNLWPTPTAMTGGESVAPSHLKGTHGWSLGAAAKDSLSQKPFRLWPTPTVQDSNKATKRWREDHQNNLTAHVFNPEKRMFPTPTSRDYKGGYKTESLIRQDGKSRAFDALPNAVIDGKGIEKVTGQLNPTWVEWLMGFPIEHTDLNA